MTDIATEQPKRSAWQFWLMVAIFAAPMLAAWFYYLNPDLLPQARSNKGEILQPVVPLPRDIALTGQSGGRFDPALLQGAWTLIYLARDTCGEPCVQHLTELRQIRLALGEGMLSVERLLLVAEPSSDLDRDLMEQAFEGMHVALLDADGANSLLTALNSGADAYGRVYILDPMGNLMMRYATDTPPEDTLSDMERLIKASKNWIKGKSYGHN